MKTGLTIYLKFDVFDFYHSFYNPYSRYPATPKESAKFIKIVLSGVHLKLNILI